MSTGVVAYLAISLDGYIADSDGHVAFLDDFGSDEYKFHDFIDGVGGIVMGTNTYQQVLGFGWPYGDVDTLVLTHQDLEIPDGARVSFSSQDTGAAVAEFAQDTDKRVWIVGGGTVVTDALKAGVVDTLELYVMPIALGSGIPLFTEPHTGPLDLLNSTQYSNGAIRLEYRTR